MSKHTPFTGPEAKRNAPARTAFGVGSGHILALDEAITELEAAELLARKAEAARIAALAKVDRVARLEASSEPSSQSRLAEDTLAYRAARADAATALHLSEQATMRHLSQAAALAHAYSSTHESIGAGEISMSHASVIMDAGAIIGPVEYEIGTAAEPTPDPVVAAKRAAYEALVLIEAARTTPNRLRPIAKSIAAQFAAEDLGTTYEREKSHRSVWVTEREGGMAELCAYLPAHEAFAIRSRLMQVAKRIRHTEAREVQEALKSAAEPDETGTPDPIPTPVPPRRKLAAIIADLLSDLLLNGTGDTATGAPGTGISGVVQIATHEEHLDGLNNLHDTEDPALDLSLPEMEGYGPIPLEMARDIAGDAGTWSKVTTNLHTGDVISVDRYRPSEEIRRFLTARDQRCRFPGCRVPVHRCDFDHTIDAAHGGPTSTNNLGALCRGHHMLKHHTGWSTKQLENGDYEWTSPTGRTHIDEPASRVRFVNVDDYDIGYGASESASEVTGEVAGEDAPPEQRPEGTAPPETEHQGTAPSETGESDAQPF